LSITPITTCPASAPKEMVRSPPTACAWVEVASLPVSNVSAIADQVMPSSIDRSRPVPAKAAYRVRCVRSEGSSTRPAPAEPLDGQLVAGNPFAVPTTRLQVVPFVEWNNSPVQLPRTQSDLAEARPVT